MQELKQQAHKLEIQSKFEDALKIYHKLIKENISDATNYNAVGVIFYKMGRFKDSIDAFKEALSLDNNYAEAFSNLGAIHAKFKNYDLAISLYKKAISIKPKYAGAYTNLGNSLNKINEHEDAVHFHKIAISLDNKSANNFANCATSYKLLGRYDKAESLYKKALSIDPSHVNAHFDLATVLLQQSKNIEGLKEYEWRFKKDEMRGHLIKYKNIFNKNLYQGQDLQNKTILVHTEQGFGDSIMVARYLHVLKNKGAKVIIYLRKELKNLFAELGCVDEVIVRDEPIPEIDYQLPMMSLPIVCDPNLGKLKDNYPYIKTKDKFDLDSNKFKIGIVWGASNSGDSYKNKVFSLKYFEQLSKNPKVTLYSLQLGEDKKDILKYNMQEDIVDMSIYIDNFLDTAKIINSLDLVITSDTSVAHLAGAMGANVWVVLQKVPDWRWGIDNDISQWYPSAKLFRQNSLGDFNSAFTKVYGALNV